MVGKAVILALVVWSLFSCFASAETLPKLGIFALGNQTTLRAQNENGTGSSVTQLPSLGGGLSLEFPMTNHWGLETGVNFFGRRAPTRTDIDNSDETRWTSFIVPLIGRLRMAKSFSGFLGFYVAESFGKVQIYRDDSLYQEASFSSRNLRSGEWGWLFGAGLSFNTGSSTRAFVELRWLESMSSIRIDDTPEWLLREFHLLVGFRFD